MLDKELLEQFKELSYEFGRKELTKRFNISSYRGTTIDESALLEARRNNFIANWDNKIGYSYDIAVWNQDILVGLSVGNVIEVSSELVMHLVEVAPPPHKGGVVASTDAKYALRFINYSITTFAIMANLKRIYLDSPISESRSRLYQRMGYTLVNERLLVKEV